MASLMNTLKREIKDNKEGMAGGAIVGGAVATYLKSEGVTAIQAAGEKGLIDVIAPQLPSADLATIKFYVAAIIVGIIIGYIVDKYSKRI